jgi:hypothetical protein
MSKGRLLVAAPAAAGSRHGRRVHCLNVRHVDAHKHPAIAAEMLPPSGAECSALGGYAGRGPQSNCRKSGFRF